MIVCKYGNYAYFGATPAEAFDAYLNSKEDHDLRGPYDLEWFRAQEMLPALTLTQKPPETKSKARGKG